MTHAHRSPDPSPSPPTAAFVPPALVSLMAAFRDFFTAPLWDHVLVLVTGAILTTGKRTVSAVLRIMGLACAPTSTPSRPPILGWYVHRWSVETTFEETREHLGVETQRQWSDLAIARTTPALLGLFSLVTLWAAQAKNALRPRMAAWYVKDHATFSDVIATVRRILWAFPNFSTSRKTPDNAEIPAALLQRLIEAVCFTT